MFIMKLSLVLILFTFFGCDLADYKVPKHQLEGKDDIGEKEAPKHLQVIEPILPPLIPETKEPKQNPDKKFDQTTRMITQGQAKHPFPTKE